MFHILLQFDDRLIFPVAIVAITDAHVHRQQIVYRQSWLNQVEDL